MTYAIVLLIGILIGFVLCYFAQIRQHMPMSQDDKTVMVKRSRLSLRSPQQTHRTHYDKYKSSGSGLYSPVKPKHDNPDKVEVGR